MDKTRTSKFISLVLRHNPAAADVTLDEAGWADVEQLLAGLGRHGHRITGDELLDIVHSDAKQRYVLSDDGRRIRASQGHSIQVDLGLEPAAPPEILFHGTGHRFADAIRREGLKAMGRHHVHLSPDEATARAVGQRHGRPIIFHVAAGAMVRQGHTFYRSANGVWLVDSVPPEFLTDSGK